MTTATVVDSDIATETKVVIKPPSMYNVVMLNDDKTSMEFVIIVLTGIFYKSQEEAIELMLTIHNTGRGIAGTYVQEVAHQKVKDTHALAQLSKYPLQCIVEQV